MVLIGHSELTAHVYDYNIELKTHSTTEQLWINIVRTNTTADADNIFKCISLKDNIYIWLKFHWLNP